MTIPPPPRTPLLPALFLLLLVSCNGDVVFREHQTLGDDYEWKKSDHRTFIIPITDNKAPYQMNLTFRCATGYPYDKAMIRVKETNPRGEISFQDVEIMVRNPDGTFNGEKGFDIIDLRASLHATKHFPEHGNYTYEICHTTPGVDTLVYAMEVGLELRQPKP